MENILYINVGYKKSFVTTENEYKKGSALKVVKIDNLDYYVESRRVETPTVKNVLSMDFISRVFKIEGDRVIVGELKNNKEFKKSIYHD